MNGDSEAPWKPSVLSESSWKDSCILGMTAELSMKFSIFGTWKLEVRKPSLPLLNACLSVVAYIQSISKSIALPFNKLQTDWPPLTAVTVSRAQSISSPSGTVVKNFSSSPSSVLAPDSVFSKANVWMVSYRPQGLHMSPSSAPCPFSVSASTSLSWAFCLLQPPCPSGSLQPCTFYWNMSSLPAWRVSVWYLLCSLSHQEGPLAHSSCSINSSWTNESLHSISSHSVWIKTVFRNGKLSRFLNFFLFFLFNGILPQEIYHNKSNTSHLDSLL